ncbi:hypothetical protein LINPERPRIM_LOCUS19294 [Linum perenne]
MSFPHHLHTHRPSVSSSSSVAGHPHLSAKSWIINHSQVAIILNPCSDLESERNKEITRSFMQGINVNWLPVVAADCDERPESRLQQYYIKFKREEKREGSRW